MSLKLTKGLPAFVHIRIESPEKQIGEKGGNYPVKTEELDPSGSIPSASPFMMPIIYLYDRDSDEIIRSPFKGRKLDGIDKNL